MVFMLRDNVVWRNDLGFLFEPEHAGAVDVVALRPCGHMATRTHIQQSALVQARGIVLDARQAVCSAQAST